MKRILYLLTAILLTAGVANAQIDKGSIWYSDFYKIVCSSVSGNSFKFDLGSWGDEDDHFTLTKTGNNAYSIKSNEEYSVFEKITTVEYRVVEGTKLLLFKDAKGNIIYHFERTDDEMWEPQILRGYHAILNGTYVDAKGTKYTINDGEFTTGGKTLHFSIDPEMYQFLDMEDGKLYWWVVTTTGINIYKTIEGEYGPEMDALWLKLKNVSPNGRWAFLSTEIVNNNTMWRFPSGLIRLMRNEIYARHGYVFSSADLKAYFSKQPWYKPLNNNAAVKLNAIETLNIDLLKANETVAREGTDDEEIEEGLE